MGLSIHKLEFYEMLESHTEKLTLFYNGKFFIPPNVTDKTCYEQFIKLVYEIIIFPRLSNVPIELIDHLSSLYTGYAFTEIVHRYFPRPKLLETLQYVKRLLETGIFEEIHCKCLQMRRLQ